MSGASPFRITIQAILRGISSSPNRQTVWRRTAPIAKFSPGHPERVCVCCKGLLLCGQRADDVLSVRYNRPTVVLYPHLSVAIGSIGKGLAGARLHEACRPSPLTTPLQSALPDCRHTTDNQARTRSADETLKIAIEPLRRSGGGEKSNVPATMSIWPSGVMRRVDPVNRLIASTLEQRWNDADGSGCSNWRGELAKFEHQTLRSITAEQKAPKYCSLGGTFLGSGVRPTNCRLRPASACFAC